MPRSAVALARLAALPAAPTSDVQLLRVYLASQGDDAFAELVRRHGPMVFAACRRVLGDAHDAEDAFQAVFVVLARKASAVRGANVAGWLYSVAVRTARGVRLMRDRRRKHEQASGGRQPPVSDSPTDLDQAAIIDEELAQLAEHYRLPVVLCELRGLSRKQAAAELGVPEGTLSSRLAAAKRKLAERLSARGLTVPAALAAILAPTAVSASLLESTSAAVRGAVGGVANAAASAVVKAMLFEQLRAVTLTAGLLLVGVCGGLAMTSSPDAPPGRAAPPAPAPRAADDSTGALIKRLGSEDFAEREAAEKALEALGESALPALRAAATRDTDPEVRRRAADLINRIEARGVLRLTGHTAHVNGVAFFPGSDKLLTVGDMTYRVWDAKTGKELRQGTQGSNGYDSGGPAAVAPDGKRFATRYFVTDWTGKFHFGLEGHTDKITRIAYAPNGSRILTASRDGTLRLWRPDFEKELRRIDAHMGEQLPPPDVILSTGDPPDENPKAVFKNRGARDAAFSPDGSRIVSGGDDGTVRVWDVETGKALQTMRLDKVIVTSVAFVGDQTRVVSGGIDGVVRVWDADSGKELHQLKGHTGAVVAVAVTPDGSRVVSGGDDGTVRVWDAKTGKAIRSVRRHTGAVYAVAVSPDGRLVASGGADRTACIAPLPPVAGAEPKQDPVAKLVGQLGSADFAERERAEKELRKLGLKVEPILKAALKSEDPEVRDRAAKLLVTIRKDALDALVKNFDPAAENPADHPLWKRFQTIAGNTRPSRDLFARIIKNADWLRRLDAAEAGPEAAARHYREALIEVGQNVRSNLSVGFRIYVWPCDPANQSAYLLLLGSYAGTENAKPKNEPDAELFSEGENRIHFGRGLKLGLQGKEIAPGPKNHYDETAAITPGTDRVFAKLLAAWLPRRSDPSVLYCGFELAVRHGAAEVLPAARAIAADKTREAKERYGVLQALAQFGDRTDLPLFVTLFEDDTGIIIPPPSGADVKGMPRSRRLNIHDEAIALALLLCDQDPSEYGFASAKGHFRRENGRPVISNYERGYFGFTDEKDRSAAHTKAKEWLDKQKVEPKKDAPKLDPVVMKLVGLLGSADFAERERAEKELRKLGLKVESILKAALKSEDPEVRDRAAKLLVAIRKDALDALVKNFDPAAENPADHPLWKRFQTIAGNTRASRDLFARIIKNADWLRRLDAAEAGPEAAARHYREALIEVGRHYRSITSVWFVTYVWPCDTANEAAYLLLLGSYPGTENAKPKNQPDAGLFTEGENRIPFGRGLDLGLQGKEISPGPKNHFNETAALTPGTDRVFARLFASWLAHRTEHDTLYYGFVVAVSRRTSEVLPFAREVAADKTRTIATRCAALPAIAQFGTPTDLPLFEALFADDTEAETFELSGVNPIGSKTDGTGTVEARDFAYGLALVLHGEDPAKHGFLMSSSKRAKVGERPDVAQYGPFDFGFLKGDDKSRLAAHAKAKEWLDKQKK